MSDASRWRRLEELLHAALEHDAADRSTFLKGACADDEDLRREVESLLGRQGQEAGFLGASTLQATVRSVMGDLESDGSLIGRRLGAYDVEVWLGAGGMGEVYKARDTRLNRTVAIKVLRGTLAVDSQLRERFDREARAISQLTHPHICTLYDVGDHQGTPFLVMEYLDGETLAHRVQKGALPLDHALRYAIEIADALEKAHRAGVVHRDLKPANVMLTKSGAKVLDFGLARIGATTSTTTADSMLPTTPPNLTAQGTILGTLQYMAPEQLEGRQADARTDIFAFGTLVYEMLTGKQAFEGRSQAALIAAILEREPAPVSTFNPVSPPTLDAVLKRCLAKDPDQRWQSAADLGASLTWLLAAAAAAQTAAFPTAAPPTRTWSRTRNIWVAIAATLGLTTIVLATLQLRDHRTALQPDLMRLSVPVPANATIESPPPFGGVAPAAGRISPDGKKLAFTARDSDGQVRLRVRLLDSLATQPLSGTEGAAMPFWAPDSRWIGFFAQEKLKKVDSTGVLPQVLCDAPGEWGGTWNHDGTIVFAATSDAGQMLSRVSSLGGDAVPITKAGSGNHQFPYFLPDGRHFIYYVSSVITNSKLMQSPDTEHTGIYVGALDGGEDRRLRQADSAAVYASPGYLLFVRQGTLFAQPFDTTAQQLKGEPVRLAESVPFEINAPSFSVSDNGILTYRTGPVDQDQLAWFDRAGKLLETVGMPGGYRGVDLSPDGKRIAVHRHEGSGGDAWVFEPRGMTTRLTFEPSQDNSSPIWSPDGSRIVFGSLRNGRWGIYEKRSDGTGQEELLVESDLPIAPMAWSHDGKSIVYFVADPKTGRDEWVLSTVGDRKPVPLFNSPYNEDHPQVSPDDKWIAYAANYTNQSEVYVKPFPSGEGRWPVSRDGGRWPRWRQDGKELFYLEGSKLMAVAVTAAGSTFEAGVPHELFDSGVVPPPHVTTINLYAVSNDGLRFLVPIPLSDNPGGIASSAITVVVNWQEELKQRVPTR